MPDDFLGMGRKRVKVGPHALSLEQYCQQTPNVGLKFESYIYIIINYMCSSFKSAKPTLMLLKYIFHTMSVVAVAEHFYLTGSSYFDKMFLFLKSFVFFVIGNTEQPQKHFILRISS